jgi:hypothetical protein
MVVQLSTDGTTLPATIAIIVVVGNASPQLHNSTKPSIFEK